MRLNRYISQCGITSRRKAESLIRSGAVAVNGVVVSDPAFTVNPSRDRVTLNNAGLTIRTVKRYYVLYKPAGVIVSRGDTHRRATVMDLLGEETLGVIPVGRLDADTTGVLLLTDDGDLAYRLSHPSFGVEKVYRAEVEGKVGRGHVLKMKEGLMLEDGPTIPAEMTILQSDDNCSIVEITIHQGRKRQVRRMMKHLGHPVKTLERISFGGITAEGLSLGKYRSLEPNEVEQLKKAVHLASYKETV